MERLSSYKKLFRLKPKSCFAPTVPRPTSAFYILGLEDDMIGLTMTVKEAFKLIISGGMVAPPTLGGQSYENAQA